MRSFLLLLFVTFNINATVGVLNTYDVSTASLSYESWPVVIQDKNSGVLYSYFRITTDSRMSHYVTSQSAMLIKKSADNGRTWNIVDSIVVGSRDDNNPNWYGYSMGTIDLHYLADKTRIFATFSLVHSIDSFHLDRSMFSFSDDTGKTWSTADTLTDDDFDNYPGVSKSIRLNKSGRILVPYISLSLRSVYVAYTDSVNALNNWQTVLVADSSTNKFLNESRLLELMVDGEYTDSGKILCLMRNEIAPMQPYYKISTNGGLTWGALRLWPVPNSQDSTGATVGSKMDVTRLSATSDTILYVYGFYEGEIWMSTNECSTFTRLPNFTSRATNTPNLFGAYYPDITPIKGSRIGVIWCTNLAYQSDMYFTTYNVNNAKTTDVTFKVTRNATEFNAPIALNLSHIDYDAFWGTLDGDGKNIEIYKKDNNKKLSTYVDSNTIDNLGEKGWVWFNPDTLSADSTYYYLRVSPTIEQTNRSDIFTNASVKISSGLNELTGTSPINRAGVYNGVSSSMTLGVPSELGYAYRSTVGNVKYGKVQNFDSLFTAWFVLTQDTLSKIDYIYRHNVLGSGARFEVLTYSDGNLYIQTTGANYAWFAYTSLVTAGQPFFVTVVYDYREAANNNKLKIYINGDSVGLAFNGTITAPLSLQEGILNISDTTDAYLNWGGTIDEYGFSDTILSNDYIKTMYNMFLDTAVIYPQCFAYNSDDLVITLDTVAIAEFSVIGTFSAIPDSVSNGTVSDSSTSGFTYVPDAAWQWRSAAYPLNVYIGGNTFSFEYYLRKSIIATNQNTYLARPTFSLPVFVQNATQ